MLVFVYFNLHKKLWSIKALEGENKGRVIGHSNKVILKDAYGKVSQSGRLRTLKTKQKNVHAGIIGRLVGRIPDMRNLVSSQITYNPYKYQSFVFKNSPNEEFYSSKYVLMKDGSVFAF